ncbi:conserved hypothetical protein [Histoplasma capsulatum H143]|uniref:Guanine nucleotide-binding protein subunit gamma n=2 Tax=Ajellomyces capsulatus TaxID=5037 RepID=C6HAH9_AJECH|nr:conserved hypothetical protein [Histoplasma capsulatum H143]
MSQAKACNRLANYPGWREQKVAANKGSDDTPNILAAPPLPPFGTSRTKIPSYHVFVLASPSCEQPSPSPPQPTPVTSIFTTTSLTIVARLCGSSDGHFTFCQSINNYSHFRAGSHPILNILSVLRRRPLHFDRAGSFPPVSPTPRLPNSSIPPKSRRKLPFSKGSSRRHLRTMPPAYELRPGGDVKNKKQNMAELKLRRLNELNIRLKEDLERPRVKVSEAAMSLTNAKTHMRPNSQVDAV